MLGETLLPQAALPFILGHEDERPAHRIWSPSNHFGRGIMTMSVQWRR